jgi:fatty acid desaturase
LLEHGEINPENPIQAATNYQSGVLFKILHIFDGGDCHLVHHIYPHIPFYNISKAIKLFKPQLDQCEVYEHRSLLAILFQVLVANKKIRECWKAV